MLRALRAIVLATRECASRRGAALAIHGHEKALLNSRRLPPPSPPRDPAILHAPSVGQYRHKVRGLPHALSGRFLPHPLRASSNPTALAVEHWAIRECPMLLYHPWR